MNKTLILGSRHIGNESDSDSKMIFQSVSNDSYIILTEKDFIKDNIQIL